MIYESQRPYAWNKEFCKQLIYQPQSRAFLTQGIHRYLGLVTIANLTIQGQIIGNCSWTNIEASILAIMFLLSAVNTKGQLVSHSEKYQQQEAVFF